LTFERLFDMLGPEPNTCSSAPSRNSERSVESVALVHIPPVETHVRWDRSARRPTELRGAGHRLRIVDLDRVRDERAAYPASRGPRLTLTLRTEDGGRAAIVLDPRRGRWFLEAVEPAA